MTNQPRQAAVMLFVNAGGELLLQLRDDIPTIRYPGHWGVIGGGVEAGETVEQALLREVEEEVELRPEWFEYWQTFHNDIAGVAIFASRFDQPAESLTLHEGQRIEFFSPQVAMTLPLVGWLKDVLPDFVRSDLYHRLAPGWKAPDNLEAASVIFVNRRGELLLRLRGSQTWLPFASRWDLIGGALEPGESHLEAVERETQEELCFSLQGHSYWQAVQGVVRVPSTLRPSTPRPSR